MDARSYYLAHSAAPEGMSAVILPRIQRMLRSPSGSKRSTLAILGLLAYIPMVNGPRLLVALSGQMWAKARGSGGTAMTGPD
jgi:hypothetical protein